MAVAVTEHPISHVQLTTHFQWFDQIPGYHITIS
jgi:hypothetical protein